jgi:hypothetical protein
MMTYQATRIFGTTGAIVPRGGNRSDVIVCNMVVDAMPCLQVYEAGALEEDNEPVYDPLNIPMETGGNPTLRRLNELNTYETSIYTWDTAAYRGLCNELGLDPDEGRPPFFVGYEDLGAELLLRQADFTHTAPSEYARNAIRALIHALHRSDKRLGISIIDGICNWVGQNDGDYKLVKEAQDAAHTLWGDSDISITFLPSADFQQAQFRPKGIKPSSDLSLVNWDEHSYWNDAGIAVIPNEPSIIEWIVLEKLEHDFGVCLFSESVARFYMQGDGAFWARKLEGAAISEAFPPARVSTWSYLNWVRQQDGFKAMLRTAGLQVLGTIQTSRKGS